MSIEAKQYSRPIEIDLSTVSLDPGDQVDISLDDGEPDWVTVDRIGSHVHDRSRCDGDCVAVIWFQGCICAIPWHVVAGEQVSARFLVGAR